MQKYRFKFYLNAVHSIEINGIMGQEHPHTWEIGIDALKSDDSFVMFTAIEKGVEQLLSAYQDKNMNKVPPFDTLNPTLENVSIYLKKVLEQFLIEQEWFLTRLAVSETPARTFVIETHADAAVKAPKENELGSWFKAVENEVDKFIAEKVQKIAGDTELDVKKVISFPYEEVANLLTGERTKMKQNKRRFFVLTILLVIGMSVLLIEKIC